MYGFPVAGDYRILWRFWRKDDADWMPSLRRLSGACSRMEARRYRCCSRRLKILRKQHR